VRSLGTVDLVCPTCERPFTRRVSHLSKTAKAHYCSKVCANRGTAPERNATLSRRTNGNRAAQLDRGEGKSYRKHFGRHEHRVIAEQKMGRPLAPGEVVHHIDGDNRNNAPENLQVLASQAEHARLHNLGRSAAKRA
jgi:hypothetical protein